MRLVQPASVLACASVVALEVSPSDLPWTLRQHLREYGRLLGHEHAILDGHSGSRRQEASVP
eukprot:4864384-Alexandrium_andersonii.AAC.1